MNTAAFKLIWAARDMAGLLSAHPHRRVRRFTVVGRITRKTIPRSVTSFSMPYLYLVVISVADLTNQFEVFGRTSSVIRSPAVAERVA